MGSEMCIRDSPTREITVRVQVEKDAREITVKTVDLKEKVVIVRVQVQAVKNVREIRVRVQVQKGKDVEEIDQVRMEEAIVRVVETMIAVVKIKTNIDLKSVAQDVFTDLVQWCIN